MSSVYVPEMVGGLHRVAAFEIVSDDDSLMIYVTHFPVANRPADLRASSGPAYVDHSLYWRGLGERAVYLSSLDDSLLLYRSTGRPAKRGRCHACYMLLFSDVLGRFLETGFI